MDKKEIHQKFKLPSVTLGWHGRLLKDTYFIGLSKLEANVLPKIFIEQTPLIIQ